MAIEVDVDGSGTIDIAYGGTNATTAAGARVNLGLGTAAILNVGTSPNQIVQLDSQGRLPAVDGSQLLNVQGTGSTVDAPVDSVNGQTGVVVLLADNIPDGGVKIIPTAVQEVNWDAAYNHSQTTHAPANAEQNVQADWNAASGDAAILNKPTLGNSATLDVGTEAGTVAAGDDPRFSEIGSGFNMPTGMVLVMHHTAVDTQTKIDNLIATYGITEEQILVYTPGERINASSLDIALTMDNLDIQLLTGDLVPYPIDIISSVDTPTIYQAGGVFSLSDTLSSMLVDGIALEVGTAPDLSVNSALLSTIADNFAISGDFTLEAMTSSTTADSFIITAAGGTLQPAAHAMSLTIDTPTITQFVQEYKEEFAAMTALNQTGDLGFTIIANQGSASGLFYASAGEAPDVKAIRFYLYPYGYAPLGIITLQNATLPGVTSVAIRCKGSNDMDFVGVQVGGSVPSTVYANWDDYADPSSNNTWTTVNLTLDHAPNGENVYLMFYVTDGFGTSTTYVDNFEFS